MPLTTGTSYSDVSTAVYRQLNDLLANGPAEGATGVSPSDGVNLPGGVTRAIMVNGAGAVNMTFKNGSISTINLAAETVYPFRVLKVWSSGTTATGITALY